MEHLNGWFSQPIYIGFPSHVRLPEGILIHRGDNTQWRQLALRKCVVRQLKQHCEELRQIQQLPVTRWRLKDLFFCRRRPMMWQYPYANHGVAIFSYIYPNNVPVLQVNILYMDHMGYLTVTKNMQLTVSGLAVCTTPKYNVGPPNVISWFVAPSIYGYNYHKP